MNMRIAALVAMVSVSLAASAFAAEPVANPLPAAGPQTLCKGQLQTLRISKIKKGGTMAGFLEAVAAHNAWYKAHGVNSEVEVVGREIRRDPETDAYAVAEDEVVTIHISPPSEPTGKDEAWTAFVQKYRDNSKIVTSRTLCFASPAK